MPTKYQVLDALRPEEFEALREDIALRGCMVPVETDEAGNVIDGHHRVEICDALGIKYRKLVRRFQTEEDKVIHALKLNLLRRHLGVVGWSRAFEKLLKVRGVRLGPGPKRNAATIAAIAAEVGVAARTARWRMGIAKKLQDHPDLAERVDRGETSAHKALREARERRARDRGAYQAQGPLPPDCRIEHCDFRDLEVGESEIDCVFCDPPYDKKSLPIFADLSTWAARKLKPSGVLLAYAGRQFLPEILRSLASKLNYIWELAVVHAGPYASVHQRLIRNASKPILLFARDPKYRCPRWLTDTINGEGASKEFHEWGQGVSEAGYCIGKLTKEGDLVCDPFLGGGTTAMAALRLRRRFIGCDIDRKSVEVARRRVAAEAGTFPVGERT